MEKVHASVKKEKKALKAKLAEKQAEFDETYQRLFNLKTVEIADVQSQMETILYRGSAKRDELVALDREITEQTDVLMRLRK